MNTRRYLQLKSHNTQLVIIMVTVEIKKYWVSLSRSTLVTSHLQNWTNLSLQLIQFTGLL